jgi:nucleoside-diphosphate-sugar epimerase
MIKMKNMTMKMEFYKDKNVLITGSSGLLGSHLLDLLTGSCHKIRVLTRNPSTRYEDKISVFHGDLRDSAVVNKAIEDIDIVFHLAALVNVDKSISDPFETLTTNVLGTLNLLESARKQTNKPQIIFSSSTSIYGIPKAKKMTEDHMISPSDPYSTSKAAADLICQAYIKTYELPITILRSSTLYGPRQPITQFIPRVILQGLSGQVLKLGSLSSYRDFCYVKDVATAFILAGATPEAVCQVFNISTEMSINLVDVVEKILKLLGQKSEIKTIDHHRPYEITFPFTIDSSKLRKVLKWMPQYDIDSGLKETIEWFKSTQIGSIN